ncbi:MAG: HAMP domain-containing sensor histidine kinase [Balneolaceae bacterium]
MTLPLPMPLDDGDPLWHALRDFLNRQPAPTVILQTSDRRICLSNEAFTRFGSRQVLGLPVDRFLKWIPSSTLYKPCRYFGRWFVATEMPLPRHIRHVDPSAIQNSDLLARTNLFSIFQLQEPGHLPSLETLRAIRQMTAVLLHRFRSPLTGIQGYLELMDPSLKNSENHLRIGRIQHQLDQLFNLMDQLEELYHLPEQTSNREPLQQIDLPALIGKIRNRFPDTRKERICDQFQDDAFSVLGRPSLIEPILYELIQNALESDRNGTHIVSISLSADQVIRVRNDGPIISDSISHRIFDPFVTKHASHLGLGLTRASLWAGLEGGCIYLTDNCKEKGVSFSVCLPESHQPNPIC